MRAILCRIAAFPCKMLLLPALMLALGSCGGDDPGSPAISDIASPQSSPAPTPSPIPVSAEIAEIEALYRFHEEQCLQAGWKKIIVNVGGAERRILWKGPAGGWRRGAIVALHGGGGTYSNYCSTIEAGRPMVDFAELALSEGFAIFSPDSLRDGFRDASGNPCGKRWFSFGRAGSLSPDLDLMRSLLDEVIPRNRSSGDSARIFVTGISNGGFMTILAATQFPEQVAGFAPVSAGDPYGTTINCDVSLTGRANAPGTFNDLETGVSIDTDEACVAPAYPHEVPWPVHVAGTPLPPFRQFHHARDGAVDLSCMEKAQRLLTEHGFPVAGAKITPGPGFKRIVNHLWQDYYNRPILDFFSGQPERRKP